MKTPQQIRNEVEKEKIKTKIHEVLWDYISHSNSSKEEWNNMLENVYNRLKEKGVIK